MSATSSSLIVPTDPQLASAIIANMLENWLDSSPHALTTPEVTDEPENLRTAEEQTGLHLCASVDACPSAPPSREHRASVCAAKESSGTGLSETSIRILDRDLGISGAHTTGRTDFKTLVADVSMGQVGAVFAHSKNSI